MFALRAHHCRKTGRRRRCFPYPQALTHLANEGIPKANEATSTSQPSFNDQQAVPQEAVSLQCRRLPHRLRASHSPQRRPCQPNGAEGVKDGPIP